MLSMRSWRAEYFRHKKTRSFVCHKWKKFGTFKKLKVKENKASDEERGARYEREG